MNILLINGSPRKNGNTSAALKALESGLREKYPDAVLDTVQVYDLELRPCNACDYCHSHQGECCVSDGSNSALDRVVAADMIVFGSPVYWWGISGALKLLVDKFYAREEALRAKNKKIALVAVGAAGLDDPEYRIIREQFDNICGFLGWKKVLDLPLCAAGAGELAGKAEEMRRIAALGKNL